MCNQFIQKIIPEYLLCTELWDSYSRRDQDGNENELHYFTKMGYHAELLMRIKAQQLKDVRQWQGEWKLEGKEKEGWGGHKAETRTRHIGPIILKLKFSW